ncbi:uncharacterized protein [Eurosta solidaginis]|uniref:uncharacterized protein n=1 Tax=Eurosta solidaginis TaxID=178769 RepID=UPI003530C3D9
MAGSRYGGYDNRKHLDKFSTLRTVAIWAGTLSLIQSIIWIGLTIAGILAHTCIMPINAMLSYGSLMQYAFYTLYFKGDCIPDNYQQSDFSMLKSVKTILTPENVFIWNCVYLGVAVCWFLASALLLGLVRKDNLKRTSHVTLIWTISILCINLMDLGLGIIFALDYSKFNIAAYIYNLSTINSGVIDPQAAQLVAGAVVTISLMIISFKGFILWLINVGLMVYLMTLVLIVAHDKDTNDTLFMHRKDSDDALAERPPIRAYEEQTSTSQVYTNEAFIPDNRSMVTIELNQEALARAARMSQDIARQGYRFRDLDSYKQYPPPPPSISNKNNNNNNSNAINNNKKPVKQTSFKDDAITAYPAPDYTPPMTRSTNVSLQNQGH